MTRESWPISQRTLTGIIKGSYALAEEIDQVNETDFSPASLLSQ
jgi:hypothetical protein